MKTILSENIWIRITCTWAVGLALLLLTWILSFRTLPEAIVHGGAGVFYVPTKAQDETSTFLRIFFWNLFIGCFPVAIGNVVRIKGLPLGYLLAFYHWGMYGILLGTNSFVIPGPGKFLPSLTTLFYGSGVYEITAYTLIAVATFNLYRVNRHSLGELTSSRKRFWNALTRSKRELILLAIAISVLAVSNYYEAWHIFHV